MNKRFRSLVAIGLVLMAAMHASAQSGYVGQGIFLAAPPVQGTIGGAAWTSESDSYVLVNGNTSGATATITCYFTGTVRITCAYAYSYYVGGQRYYSGPQHAYYDISCQPSSVTLDKKQITLNPGEEATITYTNSSGYDLPSVNWTSSDTRIAYLENFERTFGLKTVTVTAAKEGECVITCFSNAGPTNPTCKIIVKSIPPTGISLDPESLYVREGSKATVTCKMTPANANASLFWSSSNTSVATVSASGEITGISVGEAIISAKTDNNLTATAKVYVTPAPQSIQLPPKITVCRGYSVTFTPTVLPENVTGFSYQTYIADQTVVSYSLNTLKGLTEGKTVVTVTTDNGKTASCEIEVISPPENLDYRNATVRADVLDALLDNSLNLINKQ